MGENHDPRPNLKQNKKWFQKLLGRATESPKEFLQFVATSLFALAFLVVLVGWFITQNRQILQVPLILLGISGITILVVVAKRGLALAVALLVIATVVTTQDFIIKISHLLRSGGEIEEYLQTTYIPPPTPDETAKSVTESIIKELPSTKTSREEIEKIVREKEVERLAKAVSRMPTF
ncbi:hypothetical protein KA005_19455, partial [bacterium]|nr:hypothetical protein [bacterium]